VGIGDAGAPVAATEAKSVALELAYFYGLGALMVFVGAAAVGRISVRSVRDVEYLDTPAAAAVPPQPAFSDTDEVTEIQPAGTDTGRHRGWREALGRRTATH
jgi:hypothetical protein